MPLTPAQETRLKEIYSTTFTADIALEFGVSIYQIRNAAFALGLYKDKEWIKERSRLNMMHEDHPARKYWIKKGSIPKNKGLKQTEYMSAESIEKTKLTRFKKGNMPKNHRPVGYERKTKDGYLEVKVEEPNKWDLKHRIIWQQANGSIPDGYNVQFKDKNPLNLTIDNLYLITRSQQLKTENSVHAKYPKDIQLAIQAKGVLQRKINQLTKSNI